MDIKYIKSKPNILLDLIEKYPNKPWNWKGISNNKFLYNKNAYTRSITNDITTNRNIVYNVLNNNLYRDINNLVCAFCYYN